MRKGIVAILAVAIIGALGVYSKSHGSASLVSPPATSQPAVAGTSISSGSPSTGSSTTYKDGTYTGANEPTPYGDVQVAVVVSGGKITGVNFLRMPSDRGHTQEVTAFSEPLLKQTTLQNQNAHIDFVSGATTTSEAYAQSLQAALDQAA
jgi:uncharacterized protein with FMN-binding domain